MGEACFSSVPKPSRDAGGGEEGVTGGRFSLPSCAAELCDADVSTPIFCDTTVSCGDFGGSAGTAAPASTTRRGALLPMHARLQ
jgi:hypothetical protein